MTIAQAQAKQIYEERRHNLAVEANARYATETQAATNKYVADLNSATQIRNTAIQAGTSQYIASQQRLAAYQNARINADTSRATTRMNIQATQGIESAKRQLDRVKVLQDQWVKGASADKMRAELQKVLTESEYIAKRYDLDKQTAMIKNIETSTRSAKNTADVFAQTLTALSKLIDAFIPG